MSEESERNERFPKRILGLLTLITGLVGLYSAFEVTRYLLRLRGGNADFFTYHIEVIVGATFVLTMSYIVYKGYIRFKH